MRRTISCSSDPMRCPWWPAVATYTMHIWCGPTMLMPLMLISHVEKQKTNDILITTITRRTDTQQQYSFNGYFFKVFHSQQRGRFARIPSSFLQVSLRTTASTWAANQSGEGIYDCVQVDTNSGNCSRRCVTTSPLDLFGENDASFPSSQGENRGFSLYFEFPGCAEWWVRRRRQWLVKHLWNGRLRLVGKVRAAFPFRCYGY